MRTPAELIAHRGASAYAPENTLAAYDLALEQGADVLELDVRVCADGEIVTVHDPTLLRTAGDPRRVDRVTVAELRALDAAPATLDEVFARYGRATRYLVDLKDPVPGWEERVPEAIARHGLRGRVTVQSFDFEALRRLRARVPWLALGALNPAVLGPHRPLDHVEQIGGEAIGVPHATLDSSFVRAAHGRGLKVRAWTADAPADIERLLALGVDGVITNVPDVAGRLTRPVVAAA